MEAEMARKKAASETAAEPKKRASRKKAAVVETPEVEMDVGAEAEEDDASVEEAEAVADELVSDPAVTEIAPEEIAAVEVVPEPPVRKARSASKAKKKEAKSQRVAISELIAPVRLALVEDHAELPTTDAITDAFAAHYQEALDRLAFELTPVAVSAFMPPPPPVQELAATGVADVEALSFGFDAESPPFDAEPPVLDLPTFDVFDAPPSDDDASALAAEGDSFGDVETAPADPADEDLVVILSDEVEAPEDTLAVEVEAVAEAEADVEPSSDATDEPEATIVVADDEAAAAESDEVDDDADADADAEPEAQAAPGTTPRKSRKSKRKR